MKKVDYLSPSSIKTYYESSKEYYLKYLSDNRPPKTPQTKPMAAGSAFDAFVKSHLHQLVFGKGHDPRFDLNTLFEVQVEPQNRDWARPMGRHLFECYKISGALADVVSLLGTADGPPQFEFDIMGAVDGHREGITKGVGGVIFNGKPDLKFKNKHGTQVILDWKVNGAAANSAVSPKPGYVNLRDGWLGSPSRNANAKHKDAYVIEHNGVMINVANMLEQIETDWAGQLSVYAWLTDIPVGGDFIAAIDQLACGPSGQPDAPKVRIAQHRTRVSDKFQFEFFAKAEHLWDLVHSDHFFRDKTKEESDALCKMYDGIAAAVTSDPRLNAVR